MIHIRRRRFIASALLGIVLTNGTVVRAADPFDVLDINEGELQFLTSAPKIPPHLQSTHISVRNHSLSDGWIDVKQCHYNLAAVRAMQIVFPAKRVRKLEIVSADKIGRAWIEGPSVQLADVLSDASICVASENRSLRRNSLDGSYEWQGGPYMRRFLDGYFPMHVKLAIDYPSSRLRLTGIDPAALKLRSVTQPGHVRIDALFEGRLDVILRFDPIDVAPGLGWQ